MEQTLAYRHMNEAVVHLYRECPEGKIVAITKRDSVAIDDPTSMERLEVCNWCRVTAVDRS
jgi:hypothetical protein